MQLLEDITEQQNKFDTEIAKIQVERDVERFKFIEQLQTVEQNADLAISKLLRENKEPLTQLLEMERLEEERIINAARECSDESIRKEDILNAMQEMIEQETKSFNQLSQLRTEAAQQVLEKYIYIYIYKSLFLITLIQSQIYSILQRTTIQR